MREIWPKITLPVRGSDVTVTRPVLIRESPRPEKWCDCDKKHEVNHDIESRVNTGNYFRIGRVYKRGVFAWEVRPSILCLKAQQKHQIP